MSAPVPRDVDSRLSRLEFAIQRDRVIALVAVALIFVGSRAVAQSSASAPNAPITVRNASGASATLSATGLTVRDSAGKARGFFGLDQSGLPSVDLRDSTGGLRSSMYLYSGTPIWREFDANGKRRVDISVDASTGGEIEVLDPNETIRLAAFQATTGDPQFGLYGTDGKLRAYFSTDDVSPYLVMRDAAGANRVDVGGYTDGTFGVDVRSTAGATLWKAP